MRAMDEYYETTILISISETLFIKISEVIYKTSQRFFDLQFTCDKLAMLIALCKNKSTGKTGSVRSEDVRSTASSLSHFFLQHLICVALHGKFVIFLTCQLKCLNYFVKTVKMAINSRYKVFNT